MKITKVHADVAGCKLEMNVRLSFNILCQYQWRHWGRAAPGDIIQG